MEKLMRRAYNFYPVLPFQNNINNRTSRIHNTTKQGLYLLLTIHIDRHHHRKYKNPGIFTIFCPPFSFIHKDPISYFTTLMAGL